MADVDLSLRPIESFARVGDPFTVELVATSTSGADEPIASMSVIITWNADAFDSVESVAAPDVSWLILGFLNDPDGINTLTNDGDAIVTGLAFPSNLVQASPEGTTVALLEFVPTDPIATTLIQIPANIGNSSATLVSSAPGENKVGQLFGTSVSIAECGVPDSDFDLDVDLTDASAFEQCFTGVDVQVQGLCGCLFDIDDGGTGDGDVDLADWAEFTIAFSSRNP